ncbi:hypothetical protein DN412_33275 [Cupriavidus lacunae]|uniref:Uncharacterized protein n=1 Tax=Cupriavidus lacunae TaxID=2666307 RepID=A0A370NKF9_9BURK|nr:hypothetical protein DN412_33275 [Cupriavidus lacunae]
MEGAHPRFTGVGTGIAPGQLFVHRMLFGCHVLSQQWMAFAFARLFAGKGRLAACLEIEGCNVRRG